jgi:hypothetical protein
MEGAEHLFPAYPNRGNLCPHIRGFSWAKSRMDDFLGIENWRFHDIRRTVATRIQGLGYRIEVTEDILGHVTGSRSGIVGAYQLHKFKQEKREALEDWSQSLRKILATGDRPRIVVPLPGRHEGISAVSRRARPKPNWFQKSLVLMCF